MKNCHSAFAFACLYPQIDSKFPRGGGENYLVNTYLGNTYFMPSIVQGDRDPAIDRDKYITFPQGSGQTKHKQVNK